MTVMDAVVEPALRDFRAVYRAHYGLVWHALFRLGVPPDALEDAVQDVFVVAYRRRDDYAGTSTKAWLYGIARRVASNLRRTQRRRAQRHRAVGNVRPRSTSGSEQHEAIHSLDRYLASLASDDRELFILSELEGMTGPEIAEARGRKVATIYTRIRKLRQDLHAELELERVRSERPRATAHGWALLVPSLGTTATKAAGASAILGSGWFLGSLGIAATMVVATTVVRSRSDDDGPAPASSAAEVEEPPQADSPPRLAARSATAAPREPKPGTAPVEAALAPAAEPTRPALDPPRRPSRSTAQPDTNALAEENRLLAQAERRLKSGDAAGALATTRDHATRFADSAFKDLRTAVRIAALCELDKTAQARGEAAVFLRQHPGSPVADRVRTRVEKRCPPAQENPPEPDNPGT